MGPYGVKGKGGIKGGSKGGMDVNAMGDKGKTDNGKGGSKGGMDVDAMPQSSSSSDATEQQQQQQQREQLQELQQQQQQQHPPSRADLLERRIYELEGEVGHLHRKLAWLLSKLDRVLGLPADEP